MLSDEVMAGFFSRTLCPVFVMRPDIFARACWRRAFRIPKTSIVETAWGDSLEVDPSKFIGRTVYFRAAHELPVCEALWRLAEVGDTVADVGANIGVMTSVLSKKVGKGGHVLAFEAHPRLFRQLGRNVRRWVGRRVEVFERAISCHTGKTWITEGEYFEFNEGTAKIDKKRTGDLSMPVNSVRLDEIMPAHRCKLIKIDVEGHEFEALSGAKGLISSGKMRDLVFESGWNYPNRAHHLLVGHGYEIFDLDGCFSGPVLHKPTRRDSSDGRVSDYIATLDIQRVRTLLTPRGWHVLRRNVSRQVS